MIHMPKAIKTRRTICDVQSGCTRCDDTECVVIESSWTEGGKDHLVRLDYCWSCFKKLLKAMPIVTEYTRLVDAKIESDEELTKRLEPAIREAELVAMKRRAESAAEKVVGLFASGRDYEQKRISAITIVRAISGAGLRESKDAAEAEALKRWPPGDPRLTEQTENAAAQVLLAFNGFTEYQTKRGLAVNLVCGMTGAQAAEAREAIENEALKRWPPEPVQFTSEGGMRNGSTR
jgi:ribosomal protein L7/L12